MTTDQTFAAWLKAARDRAGLTQGRLAALSGIPLRTLQEYEQGRCKPRMDRGLRLITLLTETERKVAK